jgi:hypothetical protein
MNTKDITTYYRVEMLRGNEWIGMNTRMNHEVAVESFERAKATDPTSLFRLVLVTRTIEEQEVRV